MILLHRDEERRYELHRSPLIVEHQREFIEQCYIAHDKFRRLFGDKSSTWTFASYNTFALTAGSLLFHQLYHELVALIRRFARHEDPLWFQSWINFHLPNEVLDWHRHRNSCFHGYLSIVPHRTKTLFEGFEIVNEVGNVYLGPSMVQHKVQVLEPFQTPRITIAYDVFDAANIEQMRREGKSMNLSVLPI